MLKKDIKDMTREELEMIAKKFFEDMRYGLHWDRSSVEEEFIEMLGTGALPTLLEHKEKSFNTEIENGGDHLLIEGDNYHALSLLQFTHKEKIDVIYIDPPYNTGNKDFRYNDNFINKEDEYRHSKWLNFMEKRLELAKNLLKDNGVIFISIDDNEFAQLKLLCDKIFSENNVDVMIWDKEYKGSSGTLKQVKRFRNIHEYILVCYKNKSIVEFGKIKSPREDLAGSLQTANLAVNKSNKSENHDNYYEVISDKGILFKDHWKVSKDEFFSLKEQGLIYWGKDGKSKPRRILPMDERRKVFAESVIKNSSTTQGRKDLESIIGKDKFNYPKPVKLIKLLLEMINNENAVVLDFFAGSGTTGQAVLELNKEDCGSRQFILCTNNEINGDSKKKEVKEAHKRLSDILKDVYKAVDGNNKEKYIFLLQEKNNLENKFGVCSTVTYPRLKNIMTREDYNLGGNLKYFRCEFIPFQEDIEKMSYDYVDKGNIVDIVKIRENVFNKILKTDGFEIYENEEKIVAIQSDSRYANKPKEVVEFLKNSNKNNKLMYVFSTTNNINDVVVFYNIEGVTLAVVPRDLLNILNDNYHFRKEKGDN